MDFAFENIYKPEAGKLLVAEPFMKDSTFRRAVVLLTEHKAEGSIGFMLNRMLDVKLQDLIEDAPSFDAPIYLGGPVEQNTLHFVHRLNHLIPDGHQIIDGLYWNGNFDALQAAILAGKVMPNDILFFIGYSGWEEGQLMGEIDKKSWIVCPEQKQRLFEGKPRAMWHDVLQTMGHKFKQISLVPEDPRMN